MNLFNHDTFIPLTQYVNNLVSSSYVITTHNDKASQYCYILYNITMLLYCYIYFLLYFMLNTVKFQHDNVNAKAT